MCNVSSGTDPGVPGIAPRWWRGENATEGAENTARCDLCFHNCRIPAGGAGLCGARQYDGAEFLSPYLGKFSSCAVDPIEKKPLYHWRQGTAIFSLGSVGCTMRCPFCQNYTIAQPKGELHLTPINCHELVQKVRDLRLPSVAYTYNEPTLQAEYILEAAPLLRDAGIDTVLVTNGMFSPAALGDLTPWIAAANVDVKTFNPKAYAKMGGSLETVMHTVAHLVQSGVHVELTTLVVPGISDSPEEFAAMVDWIASLSSAIPLHISRYFPAYKYTAPATDVALMQRLASLAGHRLKNVHLGNVR